MILHTIIDINEVFLKPQESTKTELHSISHGVVQTVRDEKGCRVCSLFSTDLKDYLNPRYEPGSYFQE